MSLVVATVGQTTTGSYSWLISSGVCDRFWFFSRWFANHEGHSKATRHSLAPELTWTDIVDADSRHLHSDGLIYVCRLIRSPAAAAFARQRPSSDPLPPPTEFRGKENAVSNSDLTLNIACSPKREPTRYCWQCRTLRRKEEKFRLTNNQQNMIGSWSRGTRFRKCTYVQTRSRPRLTQYREFYGYFGIYWPGNLHDISTSHPTLWSGVIGRESRDNPSHTFGVTAR